MSARRHFLEPLLVASGPAQVLVSERTEQIVASTIELASDSKERTRGLLGRSGLAAGAVMIIAPCNAVHTFFMRFTIDVAFVDRQGKVLRLHRRVRPWRFAIGVGAFAALEFAEGSIDLLGMAKGDRLTLRNSDI